VVRIRVVGWDASRAWTDWYAGVLGTLERRLMRVVGVSRGEAKRLARRLRRGDCVVLPLPGAVDRSAAQSLRSYLEGLGAVAEVEDAEPGAAADRAGGK
jgi:hypothetical protein